MMPLESGFQRDANRAISMYQRQSTVTRQVNGVAVDASGNVFYANAATVGVSLIKRAGLLWTVDGAICVTTTDPGNTRQVNGFKVSAAGEMFVTTTAPAPTSQVTFDPILGYLRVSNNGAVHVAPFPALDANLAAFYLPGVGQTNASGACSAWADQSGNGRTLSEGASGKGPVINTDASLTFNGTDQWLKNTFTLAQPTVVTLLIRPDAYTNPARFFDGATVNGGAVFQFGVSPSVSQNAGATGPQGILIPIGAYVVLQAVFSGAASSMRLNNLAAIVDDVGTNSMGGFTLAAGNNAGSIFQPSAITVKGVSIRSANDSTVNANDRNFWMRVGNL